MIEPHPFVSISERQAAALTPQTSASYLLVSNDGQVSSLGMPYWGSPTKATPTLGAHLSQSGRGYALVGPDSWHRFGPEAPTEPPWLGQGEVVRVRSDSSGCWVLFSDGSVHDPQGNKHKPTGSASYVDFTINGDGVIWLESNGGLSGSLVRSSNLDATAVSINMCGGNALVTYSNGTLISSNGTVDDSLNSHVIGDIVNATCKGESLWLVTTRGLVYGWGEAKHGGNLHAPRANESVVALYV